MTPPESTRLYGIPVIINRAIPPGHVYLVTSDSAVLERWVLDMKLERATKAHALRTCRALEWAARRGADRRPTEVCEGSPSRVVELAHREASRKIRELWRPSPVPAAGDLGHRPVSWGGRGFSCYTIRCTCAWESGPARSLQHTMQLFKHHASEVLHRADGPWAPA